MSHPKSDEKWGRERESQREAGFLQALDRLVAKLGVPPDLDAPVWGSGPETGHQAWHPKMT